MPDKVGEKKNIVSQNKNDRGVDENKINNPVKVLDGKKWEKTLFRIYNREVELGYEKETSAREEDSIISNKEFMRRIAVSIRFSQLDEKMRKLLWQDMLRHTDLSKDDYMLEALAAQFELTGSNIKNIVRNAEFLALMEQRTLGIADVVMAIKIEFEKLGKLCDIGTFGMFMGYLN